MQSEGKKPNILPWPVLDTEDEYDDKHSSWNIFSPTTDDNTDAEEEEQKREERLQARMAAFKSQQTKK